jgi:hypothetical protein
MKAENKTKTDEPQSRSTAGLGVFCSCPEYHPEYHYGPDEPEDDTDKWVKKLNTLATEIDELAGSVHPSMAMDITADLRKKYQLLAQNKK